jgi:hypothetical protein
MTTKTKNGIKYLFTNGKRCNVAPGGELRSIIVKLTAEGFNYAAKEKYRNKTFTLWHFGDGVIEVHVHGPDDHVRCVKVTDPILRARYLKRIAARVEELEEKENIEGLTDSQQEWLDEHRDEVAG